LHGKETLPTIRVAHQLTAGSVGRLTGGAARVQEPICILAGEADEEGIDPTIVVHVVREGEEVVRVTLHIEGRSRIQLDSFLEVRAEVNMRARHDILKAIAIKVCIACALREKHLAQLGLVEGMPLLGLGEKKSECEHCLTTESEVREVQQLAIGHGRIMRK